MEEFSLEDAFAATHDAGVPFEADAVRTEIIDTTRANNDAGSFYVR